MAGDPSAPFLKWLNAQHTIEYAVITQRLKPVLAKLESPEKIDFALQLARDLLAAFTRRHGVWGHYHALEISLARGKLPWTTRQAEELVDIAVKVSRDRDRVPPRAIAGALEQLTERPSPRLRAGVKKLVKQIGPLSVGTEKLGRRMLDALG